MQLLSAALEPRSTARALAFDQADSAPRHRNSILPTSLPHIAGRRARYSSSAHLGRPLCFRRQTPLEFLCRLFDVLRHGNTRRSSVRLARCGHDWLGADRYCRRSGVGAAPRRGRAPSSVRTVESRGWKDGADARSSHLHRASLCSRSSVSKRRSETRHTSSRRPVKAASRQPSANGSIGDLKLIKSPSPRA